MMTTNTRDLHADLAICDAASSAPWTWIGANRVTLDVGSIRDGAGWSVCDFGNSARYYPTQGTEPSDEDIRLITEARQGWPEAIRRAIAAEAENEQLREKLSRIESAYRSESTDEEFVEAIVDIFEG